MSAPRLPAVEPHSGATITILQHACMHAGHNRHKRRTCASHAAEPRTENRGRGAVVLSKDFPNHAAAVPEQRSACRPTTQPSGIHNIQAVVAAVLAAAAVQSVAADSRSADESSQEESCGSHSVCMRQQVLVALVAAGMPPHQNLAATSSPLQKLKSRSCTVVTVFRFLFVLILFCEFRHRSPLHRPNTSQVGR